MQSFVAEKLSSQDLNPGLLNPDLAPTLKKKKSEAVFTLCEITSLGCTVQ